MEPTEVQNDRPPVRPRLLEVVFAGSIILLVAAAIVLLAVPPAWVIAAIVAGAAAFLLLVGAAAFHAWTCVIRADYAANPARAAARYGFPSYAALKASWPWYVRAVAC